MQLTDLIVSLKDLLFRDDKKHDVDFLANVVRIAMYVHIFCSHYWLGEQRLSLYYDVTYRKI